jgi:hypothetical protein
MKKISLIALLTLMMTVVSFQGKAQDKEPQTVIIRAFESFREGSKMVTTSPDGATKSIELTNVDIVSFEGNESNSVIIQSEINYWRSQGYSIDGLSHSIATGIITIIILSKKEE